MFKFGLTGKSIPIEFNVIPKTIQKTSAISKLNTEFSGLCATTCVRVCPFRLNNLLILKILVTTTTAANTAKKNSIDGGHVDRKLEIIVDIVF
jgi:hypothetical protein